MGRNQKNSVVAIETLENRTMMSVSPVHHPAVTHIVQPVKVKLVNPAVTSKSITYADFSSDPLFAPAGPTMSDINQGELGDCYLLATLSSVVKTDPSLITHDVVANTDGTYTVNFAGAHGAVTVNAQLPVLSDGQLAYAQLGQQDSIWVAIVEKAYAEYANPKANSYASINGGWMSQVFSALGLQSESIYSDSGATALLTMLQSDLSAGDFATFGTVAKLPTSSPLVADHAYEVNSVTDNASGVPVSVTFRNPWGDAVADDGLVTVTAAQAFAAFGGVVIAEV
jgi:hypothetical protein